MHRSFEVLAAALVIAVASPVAHADDDALDEEGAPTIALGVGVIAIGNHMNGAILIEPSFGLQVAGPIWVHARLGVGSPVLLAPATGSAQEFLVGGELRGCASGGHACILGSLDLGAAYQSAGGPEVGRSSRGDAVMEARLGGELGWRSLALQAQAGVRGYASLDGHDSGTSRISLQLGIASHF